MDKKMGQVKNWPPQMKNKESRINIGQAAVGVHDEKKMSWREAVAGLRSN